MEATNQQEPELSGGTADLSGVRVHPPVIALLYLLAATGLHHIFPRLAILHAPAAGIVVLVGGVLLATWAMGRFKTENTTRDPFGTPTALVATGPFSYSRNPMYLGVTLVLLGIAILVGTIPLFLAPLGFFLTMDRIFIPKEEARLERIFGDEYRDYKQRVRRWL